MIILNAGLLVSVDIPSIFVPRNLRTTIKYRDLYNHMFTVDERVWLCKFICDQSNSPQQLGKLVLKLARRHSISAFILNKLIALFSEPEHDNIVGPSLCLFDEDDNFPFDDVAIIAINLFHDNFVFETEEEHNERWLVFSRQLVADTVVRREAKFQDYRMFMKLHKHI